MFRLYNRFSILCDDDDGSDVAVLIAKVEAISVSTPYPPPPPEKPKHKISAEGKRQRSGGDRCGDGRGSRVVGKENGKGRSCEHKSFADGAIERKYGDAGKAQVRVLGEYNRIDGVGGRRYGERAGVKKGAGERSAENGKGQGCEHKDFAERAGGRKYAERDVGSAQVRVLREYNRNGGVGGQGCEYKPLGGVYQSGNDGRRYGEKAGVKKGAGERRKTEPASDAPAAVEPTGWEMLEIVEVPKDSKPDKLERKPADGEEVSEKKRLDEEDNVLLEKSKAQSLKAEERKVSVDKAFESMYLVFEKKDDDNFLNRKLDKEMLKRDNSFKEKSAFKVLNINEFLTPPEGERYFASVHGRGDSDGFSRGARGFGDMSEVIEPVKLEKKSFDCEEVSEDKVSDGQNAPKKAKTDEKEWSGLFNNVFSQDTGRMICQLLDIASLKAAAATCSVMKKCSIRCLREYSKPYPILILKETREGNFFYHSIDKGDDNIAWFWPKVALDSEYRIVHGTSEFLILEEGPIKSIIYNLTSAAEEKEEYPSGHPANSANICSFLFPEKVHIEDGDFRKYFFVDQYQRNIFYIRSGTYDGHRFKHKLYRVEGAEWGVRSICPFKGQDVAFDGWNRVSELRIECDLDLRRYTNIGLGDVDGKKVLLAATETDLYLLVVFLDEDDKFVTHILYQLDEDKKSWFVCETLADQTLFLCFASSRALIVSHHTLKKNSIYLAGLDWYRYLILPPVGAPILLVHAAYPHQVGSIWIW